MYDYYRPRKQTEYDLPRDWRDAGLRNQRGFQRDVRQGERQDVRGIRAQGAARAQALRQIDRGDLHGRDRRRAIHEARGNFMGQADRRDAIQNIRQNSREARQNYWGPEGQGAHRSPFGRQLAAQDPEATYRRFLGQSGNKASPDSAYGQFSRDQYGEVYMAYRAALQRNPLLRFDDFMKRTKALSAGRMENQYRALTPNQRGENIGLYQGPQRWV